MRRDYFTCVFLGLIAGALAFVCFKPLYFTWDQIIPRVFSLYEFIASAVYTVFFIVFLPCFAAFRKKEWVNWGLAAYGLLAYFPLWFYPSHELIKGENASMLHMVLALCLRGIYAVMQAPFAALSKYIGSEAASMVVYWILPVAVVWPVIFRILRFYRRAYLSEQLNPMTPDQTANTAAKAPEAPEKPEVLGTVISAPVTAQSPADITRKNKPAGRVRKTENKETEAPAPAEAAEKPAAKEEHPARHPGVRAPVRPVHVGVKAPEQEKAAALGAGPAKAEPKPDVIPMGAPKPKSDEAIPLRAPKPRSDEAIPLGAPKANSGETIKGEAIKAGVPKTKPDEVIQLGTPKPEEPFTMSSSGTDDQFTMRSSGGSKPAAPVRPVHLRAPDHGNKDEE